jgi:hypothetical protein
MGSFNDTMTVRQLVDLVSYLQSQYVVERVVHPVGLSSPAGLAPSS